MESADNLLRDTDVSIRDMDAVSRDVVKTIVNVNARLRLTSNQLNGFEKGPRPIFLRQVMLAAAPDHGKHAACASEYVNLHKASFVSRAFYHEEMNLRVTRRSSGGAEKPPTPESPYKAFLGLIVEATSI